MILATRELSKTFATKSELADLLAKFTEKNVSVPKIAEETGEDQQRPARSFAPSRSKIAELVGVSERSVPQMPGQTSVRASQKHRDVPISSSEELDMPVKQMQKGDANGYRQTRAVSMFNRIPHDNAAETLVDAGDTEIMRECGSPILDSLENMEAEEGTKKSSPSEKDKIIQLSAASGNRPTLTEAIMSQTAPAGYGFLKRTEPGHEMDDLEQPEHRELHEATDAPSSSSSGTRVLDSVPGEAVADLVVASDRLAPSVEQLGENESASSKLLLDQTGTEVSASPLPADKDGAALEVDLMAGNQGLSETDAGLEPSSIPKVSPDVGIAITPRPARTSALSDLLRRESQIEHLYVFHILDERIKPQNGETSTSIQLQGGTGVANVIRQVLAHLAVSIEEGDVELCQVTGSSPLQCTKEPLSRTRAIDSFGTHAFALYRSVASPKRHVATDAEDTAEISVNIFDGGETQDARIRVPIDMLLCDLLVLLSDRKYLRANPEIYKVEVPSSNRGEVLNGDDTQRRARRDTVFDVGSAPDENGEGALPPEFVGSVNCPSVHILSGATFSSKKYEVFAAEFASGTGAPLDLNATIRTVGTLSFIVKRRKQLVRKNWMVDGEERGSAPRSLSNLEERDRGAHSLVLTDATALQYREFRVIKINNRGKRQERLMGIDAELIHNMLPDKRKSLFGSSVQRAFREISQVEKISIGSGPLEFSISFGEGKTPTGKIDRAAVVRYEASSSSDRRDIVAKITYLMSLVKDDFVYDPFKL